MPHDIPWTVKKQDHPGSSAQEIADEPQWTSGHQHRIGFKNRQDRRPGLTHDDDEQHQGARSSLDDEEDFERDAREKIKRLRDAENQGKLVNFRDIVNSQPDFHLRYPENRPIGWRYVLDCTEDWVKSVQEWPANIKQRKKEEEAEEEKRSHTSDGVKIVNGDSSAHQGQSQEENDWKRAEGENSKHHDAYATDSGYSSEDSDKKGQQKSEYQQLVERYTPQEIALLRSLQHEKEYRKQLKNNDGKRKSPQTHNRTTIAIDEADQFTPDNWLPRSDNLIRLTGKHPLNAEAELTMLYDAGLITPNELHYVRNHGPVPRLLWEFHELEVQTDNDKLTLSMDDLKNNFESINIAVSLACDGNRRKELNMIRKSKGFNWGAGATGCAYWKGPLLRDVLLAAGVTEEDYHDDSKERWVNFQGADSPSEGPYETCIPLQYAMESTNDVLLAFEMNDVPLPPDHGYPVRLMIPGYVGGRCVKWLKKIWISDHENESHYHIWDNRVLPSFITEKDGEFATTMFNHPNTACNEQNLNSVIVRPSQGETIPLTAAKANNTYRIEGYAYDGGGHEVQRVEVSLDDGETWLYCIRNFPEYPMRHGHKFWTWLAWHVEVSLVHLLQAKTIRVRAWNVFKNTQPEKPSWNTMGMMNNSHYVVKPELQQGQDDEVAHVLFRHPTVPGSKEGGWMLPSVENQIANAKQQASAPEKQFTREEVEKHDTGDDCWIVVDGKVYDATSVLSWHPGGTAAVIGHAGKVHQETSDEFASIHDGFAYKKLQECALGVLTQKAQDFVRVNAEAVAKEKAESAKNQDKDVVLQKHKWIPVKLRKREQLSEDTRRYTFELPDGYKDLGLGTCQHVQIGFHLKDKILLRSYTPTKPLMPDPNKISSGSDQSNGSRSDELRSVQDGAGKFELVIKSYFPSQDQPGGAMSNILDCVPEGEEVEIRGPTGEIVYNGNGQFVIEGEKKTFKKISLVLGGSGITPGYALIVRAVLGAGEDVQVRVVDANKTEKDILLKEELDHFVGQSNGRLQVTHVLSHPSDSWKGKKGHINADIIKGSLFPPEQGSVVFLCGPPAMIQKAALPALKEWGYEEDKNIFGF